MIEPTAGKALLSEKNACWQVLRVQMVHYSGWFISLDTRMRRRHFVHNYINPQGIGMEFCSIPLLSKRFV